MSLLLSRSASWTLILEELAQGIFELLLDLGFVNGVFMPDSKDRFFAELLPVVNTANDQFHRMCRAVAYPDLALMMAVISFM